MDEYITEITGRLTGRAPILPGQIVIEKCKLMDYVKLGKITDYYLRPGRIWFENIERFVCAAMYSGHVKVVTSVFAMFPGLTMCMKFEKYHENRRLWKYKLNVNDKKYVGILETPKLHINILLEEYGFERNSGLSDYYYPNSSTF